MSDSDQIKPNPDDFDDVTIDVGSEPFGTDSPISFGDGSSDSGDIDDGDDDEGIFAPAAPKAKKSSGTLTGVVALLAVLGAGGYLYLKSPELLNQIKANILGGDVAGTPAASSSEVAPPVVATTPALEGASMTAPSPMPLTAPVQEPESKPVVAAGAVPDTKASPDAQKIVLADVALAPTPVPAPVNDKKTYDVGGNLPQGDTVKPDVAAASKEPVLAPIVNDSVGPVPAGQVVELPKANDQQVVIDTTKVLAPANAEKDVAKKGDDKSDLKSLANATISPAEAPIKADKADAKVATKSEKAVKEDKPVVAPSTAPLVSASGASVSGAATKSQAEPHKALKNTEDVVVADIAKPTSKYEGKKVVEPKEQSKSAQDKEAISEALSDKPVETRDGAPATPKTVFFDSPDGKMIKNMPAPSMNPKKGKGESIIIVTPAGGIDKVKKESKSAHKGSMSVTTTDLDPQIIAASRAMKLGRNDAAMEMYDTLYAMNARDGRILMGRAIMLQRTGRTAEAIKAYEELLTVDPDNADAVVNFSGLIRKEYPAMALNKLLDLKEKYPQNVAVLAQLGITYADSGNFNDAFTNLSHAAQLDPENPQHYFNLGVIAERAHDTQKAISYYEKALEIDAVHGSGRSISRDKIYDRLAVLRGN